MPCFIPLRLPFRFSVPAPDAGGSCKSESSRLGRIEVAEAVCVCMLCASSGTMPGRSTKGTVVVFEDEVRAPAFPWPGRESNPVA